jgi:hypothetical protein|tara:strand:+ start:352 stop:462 length:111 start_codon:yes stop_codon:yes gene_type:complete
VEKIRVALTTPICAQAKGGPEQGLKAIFNMELVFDD